MERVPNGRYTKEFREESVKMLTENWLLNKTYTYAPKFAFKAVLSLTPLE